MTEVVTKRLVLRGAAREVMHSRAAEVLTCGPAGCVAGETLLWDPISGRGVPFAELERERVRPWVQTLAGPVRAEAPFVKGVARLYRVTLANGSSLVATADHVLMTSAGWMEVARVKRGTFVLSGLPIDGRRSSRTTPGSRGDCRHECRCGDALLPRGLVADRSFAPSQFGARVPGCACSPQGGRASTAARIRPCRACDRRATEGSAHPLFVEPSGARQVRSLARRGERCRCGSGNRGRERSSSRPHRRWRRVSRPLPPLTSPCRDGARTRPSSASIASDRVRTGCRGGACSCRSSRLRSRWLRRFPGASGPSRPSLESMSLEPSGSPASSCSHYRSHWVPVVRISYERTDFFYDIHVPGEEHYLAEGVWSHNTGKSFGALYKIHLMCLANGACPEGCEREHEHWDRGMRALIVRKTHKSLTSTGLVTFSKLVAKDAIDQGLLKWYGGSGEKPAQYIYANGSSIVVGGLDNPDKIMSADYDAIFIQEGTDLTKDDWEKCTTRLRNNRVSFQQLLADCNPQQPSHWLKKRCEDGSTQMLHSRHEDNPSLFGEDGALLPQGAAYIARLDNLTGVRKERLRWGRWAAAEGMIYEDWRPDVHLIDRKTLPLDWPRMWGIDFGYTNPFVWQQWAIDPDGRLYLEKEIYQTQTLVEDHVKAIKAVVCTPDGRWKYPRPQQVVVDHDAEDRATFERHMGIGTRAANKNVSEGIQAVQARLRVQPDGLPRLFICRDALVAVDESLRERGKPVRTADEIEGYVWEPAADGKIDKDRPLKLDDHGADSLRYVVADQDLAPRMRVRFFNP